MEEKKEKGLIHLDIEGRIFVQENPTFEQEMYIMEQASAAGLMTLEGGLNLDPESNNLHRSVQLMIIQAYQSGALFRLMAALLVEEGTEWTRESADANAEFFKKVKSPESKRQLQPALVGAVLAFFESAANSDVTSLISLDEDEEEKSERLKMVPRSANQAAAAFFSGSTRSPSKKSVTTTVSRSKRSSLGKSGKAS